MLAITLNIKCGLALPLLLSAVFATATGALAQYDPGSNPGRYRPYASTNQDVNGRPNNERDSAKDRSQPRKDSLEFGRSANVDSNFGKRTPKNLSEDDTQAYSRNRDSDLMFDQKLNYDHKHRDRKLEFEKIREPVAALLQDWVPDKVDPINNGGFGVAPDNGSLVPYRLNGHLDFDRSTPWQGQP